MFSATYFTYDGVFSGLYGLMIADFDDNSVIETNAFSPSLNTNKPSSLPRFFHNGVTYNEVPQHQFSVLSEQPIGDTIRREILSWLIGRNTFKKLKIHQPDLEDYYFNCVFTATDIIFIHGMCHGFRITASFDSHYQYGEPITKTVSSESYDTPITMTIRNKSDVLDDYVYPMINFKAASLNGDNNIRIINKSDNPSRFFSFFGLSDGEEIFVDNELRYISSSLGGEKLSNFNKNWLRLKHGDNELQIQMNGTLTITCPTYVLMGF